MASYKFVFRLLAIMCAVEVCLSLPHQAGKTRAERFLKKYHSNNGETADKTETLLSGPEDTSNEETDKTERGMDNSDGKANGETEKRGCGGGDGIANGETKRGCSDGNSIANGETEETERDLSDSDGQANGETEMPDNKKLYEELKQQRDLVQAIQTRLIDMALTQENLSDRLRDLEDTVYNHHGEAPVAIIFEAPTIMPTTQKMMPTTQKMMPTTETMMPTTQKAMTTLPQRTEQKALTEAAEEDENGGEGNGGEGNGGEGNGGQGNGGQGNGGEEGEDEGVTIAPAEKNEEEDMMEGEDAAADVALEEEARGLGKLRHHGRFKDNFMGKMGEGKRKGVKIPEKKMRMLKTKASMRAQLRANIARNPKREFMATHHKPGKRGSNGVA
ncbi:uncharacterized protein [Amphiura filiformis]|uniref:uncharacterized protein n=1 Tax=Amphiura filiformis TaxID=82378 RepID=UPI003B20C474